MTKKSVQEYFRDAIRELRNPQSSTILDALDTIINTRMFIKNTNYIDRDILDAHRTTKTLVDKLFLGARVRYKTRMNAPCNYKYGAINFDSRDKRHIIPNIIIILLWKCCGFGGDVALDTYISKISEMYGIIDIELKLNIWFHIGKYCWESDIEDFFRNNGYYENKLDTLKKMYIKLSFVNNLLNKLPPDSIIESHRDDLDTINTDMNRLNDILITEENYPVLRPQFIRLGIKLNDHIKVLFPKYIYIEKIFKENKFNTTLLKLIEQGKTNDELLNYTKTIVFKRLKQMEDDGLMDPDLATLRQIRGRHWNQ